MKHIHNNPKLIEKECSGVYYSEGLKIAQQLRLTCANPRYKSAIGLAHNQVGGDKNVFVAKINGKWRNFINPTIIAKSGDTYITEEGCMTFPNKPNKVLRHTWVELEYQINARNSVDGKMFITERFEGFDATIIQHECDHLNGIHIHNKKENK
jgi:peptide deformylase|tara:strand:- start:132 stop:590 length:459 start_codon:yes stop_codon:yes gene_type:complete